MNTNIKAALPAWILLGVLLAISFVTLWPGIMSADATSQYLAAKAGVYTDHHPPLMSLVWRYLDMLYAGPGLMFSLHIIMLYAAVAIFIYLFRDSKFKWWYAVYPIIPNMLAYTALIVKDTGFTYAYLLAGAILSAMLVNKTNRYRVLLLAVVLALLFYGSAVKFQAKYLLLFFCVAVSFCALQYKLQWRTLALGLLIYSLMLFAISAVNSKLVPAAQESHSWQLVKLYDLSAISLALDKPLYPDFILQQPQFTFAKVKQQFKEHQVDPLVFYDYSALRAGANAMQREQLWQYWLQTVLQHPWTYLQVRCKLFKHNLITSPSEYKNPLEFFKTTALGPLFAKPFVAYILQLGFDVFKITLRFMWLLPLLVLYLLLGIRQFKYSNMAAPLLLFSSTSTALLTILLFCSMAGTARYVFLATCFLHAAHGFAFRVWQEAIASRNIATDPVVQFVRS